MKLYEWFPVAFIFVQVSGDGCVVAPAVGAISIRGPREASRHLGRLVTSMGPHRPAAAGSPARDRSSGRRERRGVGSRSRAHSRHSAETHVVVAAGALTCSKHDDSIYTLHFFTSTRSR
ncbi:unnamed protein product [Colias eurytheme]|nr:unnamed protein product [Colias eurytheme]